MAEDVAISIPMKMPDEDTLTMSGFASGVVTLIDQSNLPLTALAEAINIFLYEKGAAGPRWGTRWYGTTPVLPVPGAATAAIATGTTLGVGIYKYVVTYVTSTGETLQGSAVSVTTTSSNQKVNLSVIPVFGGASVTARNIYRTKVGGSVYYLLTTLSNNTATTYTDTTADSSLGSVNPPSTNTTTAAIDGSGTYLSAAGGNQMLIIAGGNIFRSTNDGLTWSWCSGASFTPGKKAYITQVSDDSSGNNYVYITDGYDYPIRYNGSTTLVPFVPIGNPSAPTVEATGLTTGPYEYFYRIAAVTAVGTSAGSTSGTITTNVAREAWDPTNTGNFYTTLTWTAVTGAVRYDIYLASDASDDAANNNYYLDSVGAVASPSYVDNGQIVEDPTSTVPVVNTTGGPRCREFVPIGARLYGVQDRDYLYRVWWSGSGPFIGYFSDAYDGGYIDLQVGSQYFPVQVCDYRDGKGDPLTTIFCNSTDTRGCIWQMSLAATTILDTQFTQPTANKLAGSRGTPAPNSVVSVLDDYMFFNYQAIYDLGSRQSIFNLLSSDEYSANVRPTLVNNINTAYTQGVCAWYYLAKVFISLPFNSTVNNTVLVYDTERKAFIPQAYTYGVERYFQYTDTTNVNHLLFWKPGDTQLSETNSSFKGDYGQAFQTSLKTGLQPTQKDRFGWMYADTGYIELSQQVDNVYIELVGTDRIKGYATQASVTMVTNGSTAGSTAGWSTFAWSTQPWTYLPAIPSIFAESTSKRYFLPNVELNNYQWHITTQDINSAYIVRTLQITGTATDSGMPPQWLLNTST